MKYSNDELILIIQETAKRLDRSPKASDISQSNTIINRFGSWNRALKKAGLKINKERSYRTYSDTELINIVVRGLKKTIKYLIAKSGVMLLMYQAQNYIEYVLKKLGLN
ncbi:homing endonuclease associated repeat-containing protein [Bacillus cereus]|uniref:homing endonuclease associated repeat-containing protein n=1 Tax=Bacillus cereus TaxID=1396 RepID=UPI000D9E9C6E|nr:hypothetical protein [Bacillus cereus]PYD94866.1 hypothetical protein CR195_028000 [Bacillus cereus]